MPKWVEDISILETCNVFYSHFGFPIMPLLGNKRDITTWRGISLSHCYSGGSQSRLPTEKPFSMVIKRLSNYHSQIPNQTIAHFAISLVPKDPYGLSPFPQSAKLQYNSVMWAHPHLIPISEVVPQLLDVPLG